MKDHNKIAVGLLKAILTIIRKENLWTIFVAIFYAQFVTGMWTFICKQEKNQAIKPETESMWIQLLPSTFVHKFFEDFLI